MSRKLVNKKWSGCTIISYNITTRAAFFVLGQSNNSSIINDAFDCLGESLAGRKIPD